MKPEIKPDIDHQLKLLNLANHALTTCWRVIFLLLAIGFIAIALIWLMAPEVKTLRPEIESFLKVELKLKDIELGELSWYWAGHFGIKADASSFSSHDHSVAIQKSDVTVNISILDLLSGKIVPAGIHLSGGNIQVDVGHDIAPQSMPVPDLIALKDMNLKWKYRDQSGQLEHFTLLFEREDRELLMRTPTIRLEMSLNSQFEPDKMEVSFTDLSWLPEQWTGYIQGLINGQVRVKKSAKNEWRVEVKSRSTGSAPARLVLPDASWPFESFNASVLVKFGSAGSEISQIAFPKFEYRSGENLVRGSLLWSEGKVKLSASSPYLEMPLIWRGLNPLGSDDWHAWLSSMKQGVASDARAEIELAWPHWQQLPTKLDLESLRYQVNGHVTDADISLGMHDDFINRVEGDVELNENGLKAIVTSADLPHEIGTAKGGVDIPWSSQVVSVNAYGQVDAGKLHERLHKEEALQVHWGDARAKASLSLQWKPTEASPRQASITLKPLAPWNLQIKETPVRVDSGELTWRFGDKIEVSNLVWSTPLLNLKTDMNASKDERGNWQVASMQAVAEGALKRLTSYYLLPVKSAAGRFVASLNYDEKWHGKINLKNASWENFLGTKKGEGEPLTIEYAGVNSNKDGQRIVLIEEIHCDDEFLRLRGFGEVSQNGLRLSIQQIKSEAFAGAIEILAPFGSDPWELDVNASYLHRKALPETLSRKPDMEKSWVLRANLQRFVWDKAEMKGVSIKLASALNSIAVMKAESLKSGELLLNNILATFSMPGGGVIDLRSLEAGMEGLHLNLSATLMSEPDGRTVWHGFAGLEGNFGHMMKKARLSNIFEDGNMRVLFSGKGELFTEQPWWQGLDGRLRMRVDRGRLMKGGTLSKFFAAISLTELPALIFGSREDLTKLGLGYKRLQVEATMHGKDVEVHKVAMRSSAMDLAGKGMMNLENTNVDLTLVMRPFQNLDAILSKLPLVRDMLGGAAHSFLRKIYWMHGPISNAKVEQISPEEAGMAAPGVFERLFTLPEKWFGKETKAGTL